MTEKLGLGNGRIRPYIDRPQERNKQTGDLEKNGNVVSLSDTGQARRSSVDVV